MEQAGLASLPGHLQVQLPCGQLLPHPAHATPAPFSPPTRQMLNEDQKNRKLNDLLDALDFNQVGGLQGWASCCLRSCISFNAPRLAGWLTRVGWN